VCFGLRVAANSGSGRGLKIFVIVGIVGAALVACIIVGVVVGVLMTTTTGVPRTPCDEIAKQTIGALPYRFTNVSESDCVYGYYLDGVCMYDGHFDAVDSGCHGKDYGADLIAGGCYYNGESTCHCGMAYREDENRCYNFAINITDTECTNGLTTRHYCLYDKRKKSKRSKCSSGWDEVGDKYYCYMRKTIVCDKFKDDGIARKNCLKSLSFVKKRYN